MPSLHVTLDFACAVCGRAVGVTLHCEGDGLKALNPTATVNIPCPNCGERNRLDFATGGTVLAVRRERPQARMPQPCPN